MAFTGEGPDNTYDIPETKVLSFLPADFPRVYEDGRIPLRVQVAQDKKVLHTVLTKPKKGIYMCSHCKVRFSNFGPLLDHIDANDIKRPHRCTSDDCPWKIVGFTKQRQLSRHIKSVHLDRNEYECTVPGCGKFFGRIDLLNRHIRSIHDNKRSRFNMKLEARRRSSATSTASTGTYDSPGSAYSSPDLPNPSLHLSNLTHPSPLHSLSPSITPSLSSVQHQQSEPESQSSNSTSNPTSNNQASTEPSNRYKHTIQFLTSNNDNPTN